VCGFDPAREQIYSEKHKNGFVQHLEPRACIGNDHVMYPSHMRSAEKNKKCGVVHALSPGSHGTEEVTEPYIGLFQILK
jgi:hypothetical protein